MRHFNFRCLRGGHLSRLTLHPTCQMRSWLHHRRDRTAIGQHVFNVGTCAVNQHTSGFFGLGWRARDDCVEHCAMQIQSGCRAVARSAPKRTAAGSTMRRDSCKSRKNSVANPILDCQPSTSGPNRFHSSSGKTRVRNLGPATSMPFATSAYHFTHHRAADARSVAQRLLGLKGTAAGALPWNDSLR